MHIKKPAQYTFKNMHKYIMYMYRQIQITKSNSMLLRMVSEPLTTSALYVDHDAAGALR